MDEPKRWHGWRDARIRRLLAPKGEREGQHYLELRSIRAKAREIHAELVELRGQCPRGWARGCPLARLLGNLERFTRWVGIAADEQHLLGFGVRDEDYLKASREAVALPELLRSQAFLQRVGDRKRYGEAVAMIEVANRELPEAERWTVLLFQSRFLLTPDEATYGRMLVHVPGEPELWVQFGILTPEQRERPVQSLSVVSVRRTGTGTEARLVDLWRVPRGKRVELSTRLKETGDGGSCYDCHQTPVIPIHPAREYEVHEGGLVPRVQGVGEVPRRLNRVIASYGLTRLADHDPQAFGPTLGPVGRERSDAFVRSQAPDLSADSRRRVLDAMRCGSCHGSRVAPLNVPVAVRTDLDFNQLMHPDTQGAMPLVREQVEQGWMPPGNTLTPVERAALYRCLMAEYLDPAQGTGLLVDWLREEP